MEEATAFLDLRTDLVVDLVEKAMSQQKGQRATGRSMPLNSLENRVFAVEFEDGSEVVAKFYRPGRWSMDQIADEHTFLEKLENLEVPVVSPFVLAESSDYSLSEKTLATHKQNLNFAVFPKVRGRLTDELRPEQLQTLGRYLARVHQLGRSWKAPHRNSILSEFYLKEPFEFLVESSFIDSHSRPHYESVGSRILSEARRRLENVELITTHGDCHMGNVLWSGDAAFLMDFDDMMIAPAVQDVWMVVRGRDDQAKRDRDHFLTGYEQMADFNYEELSLIEFLRAIRIIYYSAWIARRWKDPSFPKAFPQFATPSYWSSELEALREIEELIV